MSHKKKKQEENKVAEKNYEPSDYEGETQIEQGLAETHEQVSDGYHEGTIDRAQGRED